MRASGLLHKYARAHTHLYTDPWIAANAREQRVQDGVIVMAMQQDEAQESFEEGSFRYTAQKKIKVGCAGDHLIHRWLQTHTIKGVSKLLKICNMIIVMCAQLKATLREFVHPPSPTRLLKKLQPF